MLQNRSQKDTKKYQDAALLRGSEYFQYEDYCIPLNNQNIPKYQIIEKIGRGKYSDVYKAVRIGETAKDDKLSVLKILKPIRQEKIRREIKILKTIKHETIIELESVCYDECSKTYALAFDYISTDESKRVPDYTDQQIRFYIYKILCGLNYCHSMGIMHRDIKPQNVLIDNQQKIIKIIDWGLADYYLPNKEYNVRVASRYYKGPELLVNNKYYDYSMDMWSLGCMFAGMIFKISVFFKGEDNCDQLRKIMQVVGTSEVENYVAKYKFKPDQRVKEYISEKFWPKRKFQQFINSQNQSLANEKAIDLLKRLLTVDHADRIGAYQALAHPYFDSVRNQ